MTTTETTGSAYGSDPAHHHIVGGAFVCSAPEDAKCRTFPTCDCENWCCCNSPGEEHDEDDHCCMTTVESGQGCWIAVWVDAVGVEDSADPAELLHDEDGLPILRDGAVYCDWDDGIGWTYALPIGDPAA